MKKINEFLKQNYTLVGTKEISCRHRSCGVVPALLRIYKANVLGDLPESLVDYLQGNQDGAYGVGHGYRRSFTGNCDYGVFDAVYAVRTFLDGKQWEVEIYVSSILRRPFTEAQRDYYAAHCFGVGFTARVKTMYESSKNQ